MDGYFYFTATAPVDILTLLRKQQPLRVHPPVQVTSRILPRSKISHSIARSGCLTLPVVFHRITAHRSDG